MKNNKISACPVIENFIISQRTLRDSLRTLRENLRTLREINGVTNG